MTELSRYVRIYKFEENDLIYNTINGEVLILPKDSVVDHVVSDLISVPTKEYLHRHFFLDRILPWDKFEKRFESNNRLLISLETFLACNLSCPYCYQINNNHLKAKISSKNLDLLFEYITEVHKKSHFDILVLKILGGEPSLDWIPADYFLCKIIPFCNNNNIKLNLRIDTNCTDAKQLVSITGYDSILFTVPLCNREQHNKYRHYANGKGTYDKIIDNISILEQMPNCQIVLRHNTDAQNIVYFDEYLKDLSHRGIYMPIVTPQFTTNPDHGEYKNQLTYQKYVNWLSSKCIDSLINYGFKTTIYPRLLLDGKCQQWSNYSLKLFSDGKVGACAAHFFDSENPSLSDIMGDGLDSIKNHWNATKNIQLFHDSRCRNCTSFFGCSGHYKLPCIKELKLSPCKPEEGLYLNWHLYFQTVYKHVKGGKQEYFPGLNIKTVQ